MFVSRGPLKRLQQNGLSEAWRRHGRLMYLMSVRIKTLDAWWKGVFEFIPVRSTGHTQKIPMFTIKKKPVGHRRLFWAVACLVMSFYFFQCAAFTTICLFLCTTSFDFSMSLGLFLFFLSVSMCVWLFFSSFAGSWLCSWIFNPPHHQPW